MLKFTRHRHSLSSMESNVKASTLGKVCVIDTDADASDSSSNDITENRRTKRNVNKIGIEDCSTFSTTKKNKQMKRKSNGTSIIIPKKQRKQECTSNGGVKYRGVRKRPCGKWAAEIRHPTDRKRIWLGTFNTAEEAALVYDKEAIRIKGPNALTNFVKPPKIKVEMISGYNSSQESHSLSSAASQDNSSELMKNECNYKQEAVPSHLSDEYWLTDEGAVAVCDYFEYDNPAPMFFEQMMLPDYSILGADVSIELDADFESTSWDVYNYY